MSKLKATPGPWDIIHKNAARPKDIEIVGEEGRKRWDEWDIIGPGGGDLIAANIDCPRLEDIEEESLSAWADEARANAHLIAAAPDLYAALSEINEVLVSLFRHSDDSGQRLVRNAAAALAKARGEPS